MVMPNDESEMDRVIRRSLFIALLVLTILFIIAASLSIADRISGV
jgi:hypothetical protein